MRQVHLASPLASLATVFLAHNMFVWFSGVPLHAGVWCWRDVPCWHQQCVRGTKHDRSGVMHGRIQNLAAKS
jgi:hypothetical protein